MSAIPQHMNMTCDQREHAKKGGQRPSDAVPTSTAPRKKGLRPWLWIWLAFALQITAWVVWIKIASQHRVEDVPLATAPAHTPPAAPHTPNGARHDGENNETLNTDNEAQSAIAPRRPTRPVERPRQ